MRNPRIYQTINNTQAGQQLELDEHACKHLIQVLRMRPGDDFILFNGQGRSWQAQLENIGKRTASASIIKTLTDNVESSLSIHLGLGISKGERMDFAIQKAVELGVTEITPLLTRYSMVKLDEKRKDKRHQHWQGIIIGACEQCGRNHLPHLHPTTDNTAWISHLDSQQKLLLNPLATQGLADIKPPPQSLCFYIGPEGGLDNREIADAAQAGFTGIRLGPRVLRTETAVIAALTAAQVAWGDLNPLSE